MEHWTRISASTFKVYVPNTGTFKPGKNQMFENSFAGVFKSRPYVTSFVKLER